MKPWEQYQNTPAPEEQAPAAEQAGPWLEYQAMAGRLAPPNPVQVSGLPASERTDSDRFKNAFTQMALGIPDGVAQLAINQFGSPGVKREWQAKVDADRLQLGDDMQHGSGMVGGLAGGVIGPGAMFGAATKLPRIGSYVSKAFMPTTLGRAAGVGAVASGLQPVASDESRLANAGLGAIGGMGGYGLGVGLSSALNRMSGGKLGELLERRAVSDAAKKSGGSLAVSPEGQANVSREVLDAALRGSGIEFDSLPPQSQAQVANYVARSLAADGTISPAEAARQAIVDTLPVPINNLTRGQRTQNFVNQNTEDLLANTDSGAPIRAVREAQRQGLKQNFDNFAGMNAQSPEQVGGVIRADLLKSRQNAAAGVRDLYAKAELEAGGKPVRPDALVDFFNANEGLEGIGELVNRAKALKIIDVDDSGALVANTVPLAKLSDLRRSATIVGGGSDPTKGHFAGQTKGVIDDVVGAEGGEAYKAAIDARRVMGERFDNNQGVGGLIKKKGGRFGQDYAVADEKVVDKLAVSGSINDLKNFMKEASPESKTQLASTLAARLRDKAVGEINGQPTISLVALEREVDRIGPEKLKMMLGADNYGQLRHIMQAAQLIERKQQAVGGGSQTAYGLANLKAAGLNLLDKVANVVPGGGVAAGIVKGGAKLSADQKAVKEVLQPAKAQMERELRARPLRGVNALLTVMGGAALPSYDNYSER